MTGKSPRRGARDRAAPDASRDRALEPTASLAAPALSLAGIAALNSLAGAARGGGGGGGVGSLSSAGMLAAAAAAGEAGARYYNDRRWTQQAFDQTRAVYERERSQEKELHDEALRHEKGLHIEELEREAEQHLQDMTNQLRESQKEADRDLWEQQNTEKQSSMTVAALFLAGCFALAVEGQLPAETGHLLFAPRILIIDAFYLCLAACIAFLFVSILSGMVVVKRMAHFMLSRTAKQQETLRQLRELANTQLRELQSTEKDDAAQTNCENFNGRANKVRDRLQQTRREFSKHLWEQPMMVMGWRPIHAGRHVVSFQEWYFYDKVSTIAKLSSASFKVGAVLLFLALGIYEEGQLRFNEDLMMGSQRNEHAALLFWVTLLSIGGFFFLYLEITETVFPIPSWRNTIAQSVQKNSERELRDDIERTEHSSSDQDVTDYSTQEGGRQSLTYPGRTHGSDAPLQHKHDPSLLARLMRRLRYESSLETVNVEVVKVQGRKLFQAIDTGKEGVLTDTEICRVLDFNLPNLPIIHGANGQHQQTLVGHPKAEESLENAEAEDPPTSHGNNDEETPITHGANNQRQQNPTGHRKVEGSTEHSYAEETPTSHSSNDEETPDYSEADETLPSHGSYDPPRHEAGIGDEEELASQSRRRARQILREHSILQEAVVELLVRKVRSDRRFRELQRADRRRATRYIGKVRRSVSRALHAVELCKEAEPAAALDAAERGKEERGLYRFSRRFRRSSEKQPLQWTISKKEWEQMMTRIFHDKFF